MKTLLTALFILSLSLPAFARSEAWYQDRHCEGITEHVLPDRTRVDCLTDTHAIEYDFSHKWAEAIGQALHYSIMTGKRGGVVLIIRKRSDRRHWRTLKRIIDERDLAIDAWTIEAWRID